MARLEVGIHTAAAVAAYPATTGSTRSPAKTVVSSRPMDLGGEQMELQTTPPSVEQLMSDVRYAMNFASMNENFNRRMDIFTRWLVGLSVAFTGAGAMAAFSKAELLSEIGPWWTLFWVLVSGVASVTRREVKFAEQQVAFEKARKAFNALYAKGWELTAPALSKEFHQLVGTAPTSGQWLAVPAFNRTCEQLEQLDARIQVGWWRSRLAASL